MESTNTENGTNIINKPFEFTGKAGEFFAIWIVNVALTILTLGIYSAWAKVRTNQYFYGNTFLDGTSFRYTANPKQILKGRVIAFIVFMLYFAASNVSPIIGAGAFFVLMLLVPAFLVMSMAFRLKNSVYRNVRFNFDKNFPSVYKIFAIPVVVMSAYIFVISQFQDSMAANAGDQPEFPVFVFVLLALIALMAPWWEYMITGFKVKHAKYGDAGFTFSATTKNYYFLYLKMVLVLIVFSALIGFGVAGITALFNSDSAESSAIAQYVPILMFILIVPFYLWLFAYAATKRTNLLYNNIDIAGHKTKSELKTGYMMYLYFTNTLGMLLTVGLLMPWAKVRTARYRASVTSLDVAGDLSQFAVVQADHQSALGEEMGEMFDLDLGF